jgi:capsular polysaccharide biosynthesis protein
VRESNVVGNKDVSNIRIAEQAEIPLLPVKPKKMLNLVLSVIFGLMTGLGLSFFWEYLDRSLHTEEDIKRYIDVPVLAVIPIADSSGK